MNGDKHSWIWFVYGILSRTDVLGNMISQSRYSADGNLLCSVEMCPVQFFVDNMRAQFYTSTLWEALN